MAKHKDNYLSCQDTDDTDIQQIIPGQWRQDPQLCGIQTTSARNSSTNAKKQQEDLAKYFLSEKGSVPWQNT